MNLFGNELPIGRKIYSILIGGTFAYLLFGAVGFFLVIVEHQGSNIFVIDTDLLILFGIGLFFYILLSYGIYYFFEKKFLEIYKKNKKLIIYSVVPSLILSIIILFVFYVPLIVEITEPLGGLWNFDEGFVKIYTSSILNFFLTCFFGFQIFIYGIFQIVVKLLDL